MRAITALLREVDMRATVARVLSVIAASPPDDADVVRIDLRSRRDFATDRIAVSDLPTRTCPHYRYDEGAMLARTRARKHRRDSRPSM